MMEAKPGPDADEVKRPGQDCRIKLKIQLLNRRDSGVNAYGYSIHFERKLAVPCSGGIGDNMS